MLNKKRFSIHLIYFSSCSDFFRTASAYIHTIHIGEWIITENNTVYFARPQRSYVVCDLEWSL